MKISQFAHTGSTGKNTDS